MAVDRYFKLCLDGGNAALRVFGTTRCAGVLRVGKAEVEQLKGSGGAADVVAACLLVIDFLMYRRYKHQILFLPALSILIV